MSAVSVGTPLPAGWSFKTEEISAGVYKVTGVDEMRRTVEAVGTDPDALLEECKKSALRIASGG